MARKKTTTRKKVTQGKRHASSNPMSAMDAAAKVRDEADEPFCARQWIERMARKGYWTSAAGRTPWATLSAAIQREIKTKGKESRLNKDRTRQIHAARRAAWPTAVCDQVAFVAQRVQRGSLKV